MSKIMIASDIHGSAYYCRLMLDRFKEENAERLVLLGDILYHGPRNDLPKEYAPKEVIAMLNPLRNKIICVRGNCDTEVVAVSARFFTHSFLPYITILLSLAAIIITIQMLRKTQSFKFKRFLKLFWRISFFITSLFYLGTVILIFIVS